MEKMEEENRHHHPSARRPRGSLSSRPSCTEASIRF